MAYLHLAHSLADAFNALADEVQTLTDRKTVLEHKLRFAHEQVRFSMFLFSPYDFSARLQGGKKIPDSDSDPNFRLQAPGPSSSQLPHSWLAYCTPYSCSNPTSFPPRLNPSLGDNGAGALRVGRTSSA